MRRARLILAVLLSACTVTPPTSAPAPAEKVVRAPVDVVWPQVVAFFANNSIPIQTIEKASGLIVSQPLELSPSQRAAWIDCGRFGEKQMTVLSATVAFNVFVRPEGDSTAIRVNTALSHTSAEAGIQTIPASCVSNGHFESQLLAAVGPRATAGGQ